VKKKLKFGFVFLGLSALFVLPYIFGIVDLTNYLNVSLDPLCKDATSQSCRNYNYLATTKNKWWLINGTDDKTDTVFAASSTGVISVDKAASKRDIRPVLSIPTNLVYKSGNGSQNDPYTFYEY